MPEILLDDKTYVSAVGETVLDTLNRSGATVPSSCHRGICQTCLMRAIDGSVPAESQKGLKDTLRVRGYFLACQCTPTETLRIERPGAEARRLAATVRAITPLNHEIVLVALECSDMGDYRAGQFINVFKDEGLSRSYSLASAPGIDPDLTLHVRKIEEGRVSGWIHGALQVGDHVTISQPLGECFYLPSDPEQPLLLMGTGSGLAPLYGIIRDALHHGHRGPIHLYHGSSHKDGLYLIDELRALAHKHASVHYHPCVSREEPSEDLRRGRVVDIALSDLTGLGDFRVFLCGHPDMVQSAKKRLYLAGASLKNIYADAFIRSAA
ncbi:MAG: 2Fe-2S iron-sulfur cluster-binding protein [Acidiferrobacter sp.]